MRRRNMDLRKVKFLCAGNEVLIAQKSQNATSKHRFRRRKLSNAQLRQARQCGRGAKKPPEGGLRNGDLVET